MSNLVISEFKPVIIIADNDKNNDKIKPVIIIADNDKIVDVKRSCCCSCCCKSVKGIWMINLNCIECICKGLSYFCIGCSKCALGCHDCLEKIDCDDT